MKKEKKAKNPKKSEEETENVPFHQSRIFIIGTVVDSVVIVAAIIFILFLTHVLCIHSWAEATYTEPKTCSRCDDTEGDPLGHDFLAATCTDPETCSRCGLTQGNALGHTFVEATCTEDGYCSVCGEILEEVTGHDWIDATCEEPKTCSICGETEGEVAGHDWIEAICTEPKTCSVCGKIEGEAAGHTWVAATLSAPKTCSVCGEMEGSALSYTELGTGTVNVDSGSTLLLRKEMSDSSTQLASIASGSTVKIWNCDSSDWYYVLYDGTYGYVKSGYITLGRSYSSNSSSNSTVSGWLGISNRAITTGESYDACQVRINSATVSGGVVTINFTVKRLRAFFGADPCNIYIGVVPNSKSYEQSYASIVSVTQEVGDSISLDDYTLNAEQSFTVSETVSGVTDASDIDKIVVVLPYGQGWYTGDTSGSLNYIDVN
ncbi:MAG: SH3 domain-containing protein [Ruminococcus sp.]|nr:SH3 domain-containing protein [Ruminococcus sp.]